MRHTFLSIEVQYLGGQKLIELAAYCGTSVAMLERHYVKRVAYVPTLGGVSNAPAVQKTANLPGEVRSSRRKTQQNEASPSIASLNRTLTGISLNQVAAWVREMDSLRRVLAA
jgi:hypothetical protein